MRTLIAILCLVLSVTVARAQAKGDDLLEIKVQASNLDAHRDDLEKRLASEQVRAYRLANEVDRLKKQLAEVKKAVEEQKAAEKKPE